MLRSGKLISVARRTGILGAAAVVAACAQASGPVASDHINDPFEAGNRKVHAFNTSLLGAGSGGFARVVPPEFQTVIGNVAGNLSMPQVAVNSLLQGDLRGAGVAGYRFAVNSTVGLGGIIDATGEFGGPTHDTDFGETLHVWGVPEGAYLELPFIGPSTQRDAAGRVVDLFTDPLSYALDHPQNYAPLGLRLVAKVVEGSRRSDMIGDLLDNSADSYAQARLIYLQKRRYELGGKAEAEPHYEDPYAE